MSGERGPSGTGGTALPPGNCATHGYHGRVACPRCSTSSLPPALLVPAERGPSGTGHDTAGEIEVAGVTVGRPKESGRATGTGGSEPTIPAADRVTEAAPAPSEQDLRDALIAAVNGHRISPDLAWAIIGRWDRADPPVAVPGPASVSPAEPPGFRADIAVLLDAFADVPEVVRVLKVTEEAGEAAQAYIGVLGLNPRKGITHSNDELADELADVALTALVALGAFTADPIQRLTNRVAYVAARHRREVLDRAR